MENISKLSPIEVAVAILTEKNSPMNINELLDSIMEAKGYDKEDNTIRASLYCDLVASSKFVYLGEDDLWDLKLNHSLEAFDKDGAYFTPAGEEYVDDEPKLDEDDLEEDEDHDEEDEEEFEEESDEDEDLGDEDEDADEYDEDYEDEDDYDDSADEDDFEEDKYNELMDDYEDMYD